MSSSLKAALSGCDVQKPFSLLIRHAQRPKIPKGVFGETVYLTPEGLEQSRLLAVDLKAPLSSASHSPIFRCEQTVRMFIQGTDVELEPQQNSLLFLAYFYAQEKAEWVLANRPVREIVTDLIEGRAVEGMKSIEEGSQSLLELLFSPDVPGLHLFASHDLLICLLNHYLFGLNQFDSSLWPDFLEGIVFWESEGDRYFSYQGKQGKIR